jgi:hypothetical protein
LKLSIAALNIPIYVQCLLLNNTAIRLEENALVYQKYLWETVSVHKENNKKISVILEQYKHSLNGRY